MTEKTSITYKTCFGLHLLKISTCQKRALFQCPLYTSISSPIINDIDCMLIEYVYSECNVDIYIYVGDSTVYTIVYTVHIKA